MKQTSDNDIKSGNDKIVENKEIDLGRMGGGDLSVNHFKGKKHPLNYVGETFIHHVCGPTNKQTNKQINKAIER